ncbi:MAG TPA: hypothetical protein DEV93_00610 [Chloroflexi bacterium]|jgi:hypothetical protein|nr:hypothetical protein [Chloroflexota bacterium]
MRPGDVAQQGEVKTALRAYEALHGQLPGISDADSRDAFVAHVVDSGRRPRYVRHLLTRDISHLRADPDSDLFDPIKAAIWYARAGSVEEALWLAFLSVHFGRHSSTGWRYCAAVYGRAGEEGRSDWAAVSGDVSGFVNWLTDHLDAIRLGGGGFGNHRKYETLGGTGQTVSTYVDWVGSERSQVNRFRDVIAPAQGDAQFAFDLLYTSLATVVRFGRTARFDLLASLSWISILPVTPGRAYLEGATGPLRGAKLLFGDSVATAKELDQQVIRLGNGLPLGFDVLEDALCNWQKSPTRFIAFRG